MTPEFENAIPVGKEELRKTLARDFPPEDQPLFHRFAMVWERLCHFKFQQELEILKEHYHPFDPDTDRPIRLSEDEEAFHSAVLIKQLEKFLERAHYLRISEREIRLILNKPLSYGIRAQIDLAQSRDWVIYYRGETAETVYLRPWYWLWLRKKPRRIQYYQRLAVLLRTPQLITDPRKHRRSTAIRRSTRFSQGPIRHVTLPQEMTIKLFKNIRQDHLQMIFPQVSLTMGTGYQILLASLFILALLAALVPCFPLGVEWRMTALGISLAFLALAFATLLAYQHSKERHQSRLIKNFYEKSLNTNAGVFHYLSDLAEEEEFKESLLVLHSLWKRRSWALSITVDRLEERLKEFVLETFGVKTQCKVEPILEQLGLGGSLAGVKAGLNLIESPSLTRAYLEEDALAKSQFLTLTAAPGDTFPLWGEIGLAPGTERSERKRFVLEKDTLWLEHPEGAEHFHPAGSPIRWVLERPYRARLAVTAAQGASAVEIEPAAWESLPRYGLARIGEGTEALEVRYRRPQTGNRLELISCLRYRHTPQPDALVLVRPTKLRVLLETDGAQGNNTIPLPEDHLFPGSGTVLIGQIPQEQSQHWFVLQKTADGSSYLELTPPLPRDYPRGTALALVNPTSHLTRAIPKKSRLIPLKSVGYFSTRGVLILSPGSEIEERLEYQREIFELEIDPPLKFAHPRGSMVYLPAFRCRKLFSHVADDSRSMVYLPASHCRAKLFSDVAGGSRRIVLHGFLPFLSSGPLVLDPETGLQEERTFTAISLSLFVLSPTRFSHPADALVEQARLESLLLYDALQGSHTITVEDAMAFPLAGTLQIHFHGSNGVKEVFPYKRREGSNTLYLIAKTDREWKVGTVVTVVAVEKNIPQPIHYRDREISLDLWQFPEFPQHGKLVVEQGNPSEETLVFQRYPNRLRLDTPLLHSHSRGTAVDFGLPLTLTLADDVPPQARVLSLDHLDLLPATGEIRLVGAPGETVSFRRKPNRLHLLTAPRLIHAKGIALRLVGIARHLRLAESAERSARQIQILNGEDLPSRGVIVLRSVVYTYSRTGTTFFLDLPLRRYCRRGLAVQLPDLHLQSIVAPGDAYLEIDRPSLLPAHGQLLLEPRYAPGEWALVHRLCSFLAGLLGRRRNREERLEYRLCPHLLWLEQPVSRGYATGTPVALVKPMLQAVGDLSVSPLSEANAQLEKQVDHLFLR